MSPSDLYWKLVRSLIDRGITTREGWHRRDPVEYRHYYHRNQRGFRVREILADVVKHMYWSKTFSDFAVGCQEVSNIRENTVYQILRANGYDPKTVGTVLVKWAGHLSPRNTVWINGLPRTGAPQLAEALVYLSPLVGSVNWRNRVNPFERCGSSLVLWWDGGCIYNSTVGLVKQVLGGEYVLVPRDSSQGGGLSELFKTPVIIYSAHDICKTVSLDGKESEEYSEGLRDTMYKITLTETIAPDVCIGCGDVGNFLSWASKNITEAPDTHELK